MSSTRTARPDGLHKDALVGSGEALVGSGEALLRSGRAGGRSGEGVGRVEVQRPVSIVGLRVGEGELAEVLPLRQQNTQTHSNALDDSCDQFANDRPHPDLLDDSVSLLLS